MVAEYFGMEFIKSSITECAKAHGFNSVGELPIKRRFELQQWLLHDHVVMLNKAKRPAITDRTPIDMIGYMLCEVGMHSHANGVDQALQNGIEVYVEECLEATRQSYDMVLHVCRLPTYEVSDTRPNANGAYHLHSDLVMAGALRMSGIKHGLIRSTDLEERFTATTDMLEGRMNKITEKKADLVLH